MEVRDKLYIGGAWVPSTGKDVIEVVNSTTEEVIGTIPPVPPRTSTGRTVRRRCLRGMVGDVARRAVQDPRAGPGGADGAHHRDRHVDLPGSRHALHAVQPHPGRAARDELLGRRPARHRVPLRGGGGELTHRPRARRRGRGHHPVELPAAPDRGQGGAGAGGGLHRGAEAERGGSAQRLHPGRDPRRHRPPAGRVQPRDRGGPGRGRGHRLAPARRHGVVHGIDRVPASASCSWRPTASSASRSSSAASRPTSSSRTPTCPRRCPPVWPPATSTRARPARR